MLLKLLISALLSVMINIYADDNIQIYNSYGNSHEVIIQGRLLHKKEFNKVKKSDNFFQNLYRRAKEFVSDEIKNKIVKLDINHEKFKTKSDFEGYFQFDVTLKKSLKTGYHPIKLKIKDTSYIHDAKATIIDKKMIGIVCDFDDTIVVSNVTNKLKLAYNTIFKNYKQRKLIKGIKKRLEKILSQNPKTLPTPLFILSGSPQQLFNPIEGFLNYHHFPKHILILKKSHGINKDPLTDQYKYKTQKIEKLLQLYPNMKWVMFGDSGEKDREVYESLIKKYPDKILRFYIRDVNNETYTEPLQ